MDNKLKEEELNGVTIVRESQRIVLVGQKLQTED